MGAPEALSYHVEFQFQVVITFVIVIAAWVAGWRLLRAIARRNAERREAEGRDGDA